MEYQKIEVGKIFECGGRLFAISVSDSPTNNAKLGGGLQINEFIRTEK